MDLLTAEEHELVDKLAQCFVDYVEVSKNDGVQVANNRNEFAYFVHVLQDKVLARAAARAFPGTYRL